MCDYTYANYVPTHVGFIRTTLHIVLFRFYPSAPKQNGYCWCLRPSVCLSVAMSVRPYDKACDRDELRIMFQIFFKLVWIILCVNISDMFYDGHLSSIDWRIIDHKWYFSLLGLFFFKSEHPHFIQLGRSQRIWHKWRVLRNFNICNFDEF